MAEQFANLASTTLTANYTAGGGSITVNNTAGDNASFPFPVGELCCSMMMKTICNTSLRYWSAWLTRSGLLRITRRQRLAWTSSLLTSSS